MYVYDSGKALTVQGSEVQGSGVQRFRGFKFSLDEVVGFKPRLRPKETAGQIVKETDERRTSNECILSTLKWI
jgi:hypothetical protein